MLHETDVAVPDGRVLHVYDTGGGDAGERLAVVWHHGAPNVGEPPRPLFAAADRLGLRWVGYDRPGYGGSTARPGRTIASAATDVAAVADALGLDSFAGIGHSAGAAHALACAALLPDRVVAAVATSGLAPFGAEGLDWLAGFADVGAGAFRAALRGRAARERYDDEVPDDADIGFTAADWEALSGDWSWLLDVVRRGQESGPGAAVDDDLAAVAPWGFEPADIRVPVLIAHGGLDRMVPASHARWLAHRIPSAELWLRPDDGHITVLASAESALEWLAVVSRKAPGPTQPLT
jgi:pimeloyl-ACP methyl ester carboxylesterase